MSRWRRGGRRGQYRHRRLPTFSSDRVCVSQLRGMAPLCSCSRNTRLRSRVRARYDRFLAHRRGSFWVLLWLARTCDLYSRCSENRFSEQRPKNSFLLFDNPWQESQAEALLRRANDSKQWLPYKNSCGGRDVVLMGKDRPGHNNNIIYYHRHPLNSMRFYSLGMDDAVIQNARHSGLDANVINQVSSCSVNPRIRTNRLGFSSTRLKC